MPLQPSLPDLLRLLLNRYPLDLLEDIPNAGSRIQVLKWKPIQIGSPTCILSFDQVSKTKILNVYPLCKLSFCVRTLRILLETPL